MKISKIFAGMSAMALAASMLSMVSVSADEAISNYEVPAEYLKSNTVYLVGEEEKGENGPFASCAELTSVTSIKFIASIDEATAQTGISGETWLGGGAGTNSDTLAWNSHEWCFKPYVTDDDGNGVDADGDGKFDPVKELTWQKVSDGVYEVTLVNEDGFFFEDDTYAQIWMQDWSSCGIELTGVVLNPTAGSDTPAATPYENVYAADIEGNGNLRIELFNIYGDTNNKEGFADAYATLSAAEEIEVQFTIQGIPESEEGFTAFLMYTDANWAWGNWGAGTTPGAVDVVVNGDGTYSVKINNEIAGATAEDGGAMVATGANVFCVDILGLADAAGAGTKGVDGLETAADKQALAVEKGLVVTDVKVFTDGVEFVPGVGYKDEPVDESSSEAEPSSSEAPVESSSSESTTDSAASSSSKAATSSKASNNSTTTNPNTGAAALAAVGVALAGAAVVASKKRK